MQGRINGNKKSIQKRIFNFLVDQAQAKISEYVQNLNRLEFILNPFINQYGTPRGDQYGTPRRDQYGTPRGDQYQYQYQGESNM